MILPDIPSDPSRQKPFVPENTWPCPHHSTQ